MCGIIGFCGMEGSTERAAARVLEGLRRLEYRGYDSAGVAAVCDGALVVRKDVGHIDEVDALQHLGALVGDIAIGHTRWATHGGVTQANAHPHTDASGRVAVVHNGIIENYLPLRAELESQGVVFASETDTEVIPHLISAQLHNGHPALEDAVRAVCARLEGSYAFVAVSADEPDRMVGVRQGNPLVVGFGEDGAYLGSDVLAFASKARTMATPDNGEVVVLARSGVRFMDGEGREVEKERRPVDVGWTETDRNGYPHFMLKEILEQPEALLHTLEQDDALLMDVAVEILRARQVVFTACGTSRHAALIGRYLFSHVAKKFSDVVMASEFGYFSDSIDRHTVVIAVSQSGETADVLDGVRLAKEAGAHIVGIVNRPSCLLVDESDHVIRLNCGPEVGVAATKTFVSQLSVFYQLAFAMVNRLGEARCDLQEGAHRLDILLHSLNGSLQELAWELREKEHAYYIGRGINFATAMEGALKMKEISYVHAEGMPAGELKHGTLALIEEGMPVVAICPGDETHEATVGNAIEAKARGGRIIGVSDVESEVYDDWLRISRVPPLLYPVMLVPPLQLLAYHMAVERGCDPDRPRNLAKSVTVR
ncbi:MAG: glutamine--fructose-6-phosphate transaminase (isomerizing) [Dehalococcoidia bacterium]|jgi:glucosamine--fructose-6-phosphate aminotransferase (isomerizing)|nr:glutamine--fructose-6-phosphate transaminase (isomerizing) [Dehalococcoidia bacterium]